MTKYNALAFPLLLVGLVLALGTSSLQSPAATTSGRRRGPFLATTVTTATRGGSAVGALKSLVVNGEQKQQHKQEHVMNPQIPTTPEEPPTEGILLKRKPKTTIWRYVLPSKQMLPELVAEAFGTFLLLHFALGIVLSANFANSMQGVFPIAVLTGMAITAACAVVSSKCAAHFNPAITWAMCLYRNFGWTKFLPYLTAQCVGATASALVNYGLYAGHIAQFEAQHKIVRSSMLGLQTAKTMGCYFAPPVSAVAAFLAETCGTFALTAVVFSLTSERNQQVRGLFIPPIIGSTVALIISIIGPISCASLNPAREVGPRLILRAFGWSSPVAFKQLGIYVGAAMLGATLAGMFVDKCLYSATPAEAKTE